MSASSKWPKATSRSRPGLPRVAHAVDRCTAPRPSRPAARSMCAVADGDVDRHVEDLPHLPAVVVPLQREPVAGLRP